MIKKIKNQDQSRLLNMTQTILISYEKVLKNSNFKTSLSYIKTILRKNQNLGKGRYFNTIHRSAIVLTQIKEDSS